MLIEFRFQNHRSIRDEQVFSMEAGSGRDTGDLRRREVPGHKKAVLPVAAIYGANASGKSNVLSALGFMRDAVIDSHHSWPPEGGVPRDAFAWGQSPREPSLFELVILLRGVRYQYGFVVDQASVIEEWLYAWPKGRRQSWFEREEGAFSFGESLKGENRSVVQVTRGNALFLSTAAQHQHEQLLPIYSWFRQLRTLRVEGYKQRYSDVVPAASASAMFAALAAASAASAGSTDGMVRLRELLPVPESERDAMVPLASMDEAGRERVRDLLRAADMGISEFRVEHNSSKKQTQTISVQHHGVEDGGWLALERESAGTRTLFHLAPVVIDALSKGTVLIIDELESSLHPLLALEVVKHFNSPQSNPRDAQLVFATHDTHLLGTTTGEPTLIRDQIWLTEKDREGATTLYPLTEFKPRRSENLERGYLQGRYGAIPFLGSLTNWEE